MDSPLPFQRVCGSQVTLTLGFSFEQMQNSVGGGGVFLATCLLTLATSMDKNVYVFKGKCYMLSAKIMFS